MSCLRRLPRWVPRPSLNPLHLPESEDGTRRFSPPGAPVRSRVGKWGSCSPTPTVVSPGSAIVRGRTASSRGPSVVSSVPFAALDRTLLASLTAGDNREQGERVGTSPNARLQSCLGFAVRSAKRDTESVRGLARSLVRRASEDGGERNATSGGLGGNACGVAMLCLPPAIRICPGGVYAVKLQLGHRRRPDGQTTLVL